MPRLLLLFTLLIGMALRCVLITAYPLREDEAVYSTWALHFLREDPLFLSVWPDKPPVFIWLLSAIFWLLGASEFSARWLNIAASVLTIPVVAATARQLWGKQAALLSAILLALNPFAIAFSPTAYTDPLLVFCGSAALYFAVAGRGFWSGVWLGLAIMTKQQGVLYGPLIFYPLLACHTWGRDCWLMSKKAGLPTRMDWDHQTCVIYVRECLTFLGGVALIVAPIIFIDSLRWSVAPSPWDLSIQNYGTLRLLPISEWLGRAWAWFDLLWYLVGSSIGWLILAGVLVFALSQRRKGAKGGKREFVLLLLWGIGFVVLHIITSVQIWDRYLLPLASIFTLLVGSVLSRIGAMLKTRFQSVEWVLAPLLFVVLLPMGLQSAYGRIPLGGDHGALAGLHDALNWIQTEQGAEPFVLYHQSLGPQYRFYLYEAQQEGNVDLRWYPHSTYLVDNAVKIPHRHKFLLQPMWAPTPKLGIHAASRGVKAIPIERFGRFQLVELTVEQPGCDWCVCQEMLQTPVD